MCIGTAVLRSRGWRAFSIAEDTELWVELTRSGCRVEIAPAAIVRAQEARNLRQGKTQRTRWRAGRLEILRRIGPKLLETKELGFHQRLDMLGELLVPGPLVHFGIAISLGMVVWLLGPPGEPFILALLAIPILRWGVYGLLALRDQPEPLRTLAASFSMPLYIVWRMATEVSAIRTRGQQGWVRTERHSEEQESGERRKP
jgi:cellulose synthase/poly-beta-1,6-N-acetylglucosamine synthase-like glycosyltransferase